MGKGSWRSGSGAGATWATEARLVERGLQGSVTGLRGCVSTRAHPRPVPACPLPLVWEDGEQGLAEVRGHRWPSGSWEREDSAIGCSPEGQRDRSSDPTGALWLAGVGVRGKARRQCPGTRGRLWSPAQGSLSDGSRHWEGAWPCLGTRPLHVAGAQTQGPRPGLEQAALLSRSVRREGPCLGKRGEEGKQKPPGRWDPQQCGPQAGSGYTGAAPRG